MSISLQMYVIYKNPSDYPNKYVARLYQHFRPTDKCIVADTFEEIQKHIPCWMHWIERYETDNPVILGVYI